MKATPNFPVSQGTELIVSCMEGYGLVGDDRVTCEGGKQFGYQTKPQCGTSCSAFTKLSSTIKTIERFKTESLNHDALCLRFKRINKTQVHLKLLKKLKLCIKNTITVEQCTGFKATWTNIQLAESEFPVSKNTAVTIKCQEDFYISGDTIVTCLRDTEFTFATEPTCGKF